MREDANWEEYAVGLETIENGDPPGKPASPAMKGHDSRYILQKSTLGNFPHEWIKLCLSASGVVMRGMRFRAALRERRPSLVRHQPHST